MVSAFSLISSFLSSQAASSQVLSAFVSLTTVFGMGTGVSSQLSPLNLRDLFSQNYTEERPKAFRHSVVLVKS